MHRMRLVMHIPAMKIPLTRQQLLLAAIGHASRFRLFILLAERERCVTELATNVGLSQSCTTRHLQTLSAAGVVHAQRDGKRVRVRLRRSPCEVPCRRPLCRRPVGPGRSWPRRTASCQRAGMAHRVSGLASA